MTRSSLRFAWREPDPARGFASGVSLHSHTCHSRECLAALPRWLSGVPLVSWELHRLMRQYALRHGVPPDLSGAFWTPPMSALAAHDLERRAIVDTLGLPALVSLTDHDTIAARHDLCESKRDAPISVEWTVPFRTTFFHVGVHNLPPSAADATMRAFTEYQVAASDRALRDLFAWLHAQPGVLTVLNHPFWDQSGIGAESHQKVLQELLDLCAGWVHAVELNGLRSWRENERALDLAAALDLPCISGGDRHGCEPNAIVNLTGAGTFGEFVAEMRAGCSHVLVLPRYREPLQLRVLRTLYDVLHASGASGRRECWSDRVFYAPGGEAGRPLSAIWPRGAPPVVRLFVTAVSVGGHERVQRPLRRLCTTIMPGAVRDVTAPG
jgi:hypothetical protein